MNLWINYGNEAYSNYYVEAETERFLYIDYVTVAWWKNHEY